MELGKPRVAKPAFEFFAFGGRVLGWESPPRERCPLKVVELIGLVALTGAK